MTFKNIKAVVFDFDGVFTNNQVFVSEDGKESVLCNRSDGIGLEMLRMLVIPMTIISTEKNPVVSIRARKLNLPVKQGVKNKVIELDEFSKSINVGSENIAFVGNDINDTECMKKVGFPIAVADSVDDIKEISSFISHNKGGDGAVREICELIYKSYQND